MEKEEPTQDKLYPGSKIIKPFRSFFKVLFSGPTSMCTNQKILLLLILILRYPIDKECQTFGKLDAYYLRDQSICPTCFEHKPDFCKRLRSEYEFNENFLEYLDVLLDFRHNRILRQIESPDTRIFAKYLITTFDFTEIKKEEDDQLDLLILEKRFMNETRPDGMRFCPTNQTNHFIDLVKGNYSDLTFWMYMNIDIQPLLLPYLNSQNFPVPKTHGMCGFTMFQSHDGIPLYDMVFANTKVKLEIAAQLIEGALKFTKGVGGYRFYLTDITLDNVAFNTKTNKISFIDLDNVVIVDARTLPKRTHKYEFMPCYGCVLFPIESICESKRSDTNLFSVCQLLREDLFQDQSKGFLYDVLKMYPHLYSALNECIYCNGNCINRFNSAHELLNQIRKLIRSMPKS